MIPAQAAHRTIRRLGKGWLLALPAALASGCADSIPPENAAAEEVAGRNGSVSPTATAPEESRTEGKWRRQADGETLDFAAPVGEVLLRLSCHGAGGMVIDRFRSALVREPSLMAVKAGEAAARLATEEIETPRQGFRAVVPADHPLMKQLVSASGLLSIDAGEQHALKVPMTDATAGLARVCERREIGRGKSRDAG